MIRSCSRLLLALGAVALLSLSQLSHAAGARSVGRSMALKATIDTTHGVYSLASQSGSASLNGAAIAAKVNHTWLQAIDYPRPTIAQESATSELGAAQDWTVTYFGAPGKPDLIYDLRVYAGRPFADLQVTVRNSTPKTIHVQAIRPIQISHAGGIELGGPETDERVLSDSFSEDRPEMKIRDLGDPVQQMHRGVGSQLIYNRKSGMSFFAAALTSDRFLTILRAHVDQQGTAPGIVSYEVDSAGTTELTSENSLRNAPAQDRIELSVPVEPGQELKSERLLLSLGADYHAQLETYGKMIRSLHHARVSAPAPMGWWSWTAYYQRLTQGVALADADWLAKNLKPLGYDFFHVDEGYSVARGDYLTANSERFPDGMEQFEKKIADLGLRPAIWTAPFEVSDKSSVYQDHPDWLVHNYEGKPIRLTGSRTPDGGNLYVLDSTNPGAQAYLSETYSTMAKIWGLHYFKLDFMEDSCIEARYYKAGTTALQAQRIGLSIIRSAVGDHVLLDKDGSPMLNPVGIVDMGRISQDTGHDFGRIKAAATGIAARYYMNRNYFVADPDAFMVARGEGKRQMSLNEAEASIALSAVSGGMFEIGDKLPEVAGEPERLALVRNRELIAMASSGRASFPVDLLSYHPEDLQPSIFMLKKDAREGILTVFNWTDGERTHDISLASLGLNSKMTYKVDNVWDGKEVETCKSCVLKLQLEPHSVRMLKITETLPPAR